MGGVHVDEPLENDQDLKPHTGFSLPVGKRCGPTGLLEVINEEEDLGSVLVSYLRRKIVDPLQILKGSRKI